jgi:hypothetical protein
MYPIKVLCNICKDLIASGITSIATLLAMGDKTTQPHNFSTISLLLGDYQPSTTVTMTHTTICKKKYFFIEEYEL